MTHSNTRARPRGDVALALGGMLALASSLGIGRFVYTPILPAMAAALGLSKAGAGLIASANFAGYLAGALLAAAPRLPGDRRAWFLGALALGAAATAGMAGPGSMAAFLLLRFAGGAASAFVLVLGSALVLDRLAASGRPGLAALHFAGVGLGIAASAALVDALQEAGLGWRGLWLASGALAGVVVPVSAWLVPGIVEEPATAPAHPRAERLPRGLGALSLCHGLFGFGYVVTATFLVVVVRGTPGARALEAGVWLAVGLAAAPSAALWGWAGARWGALRAYGPACLLEAVGVAAGGLWPTPAGALLASVLLGGTFMGVTALGFAAAGALAPGQQRRSFALMTAGFGVGQIAGPVAAGWLLDRTGSFAPPSLIAAAALAGAAVIATLTARHQRRASSIARRSAAAGSSTGAKAAAVRRGSASRPQQPP